MKEEQDEQQYTCPGCGGNRGKLPACTRCLKLFPPTLLKACENTGDYALKLRTGEIIFFVSANFVREPNSVGAFATLTLTETVYEMYDARFGIDTCTDVRLPIEPQTLEVRMDDIVWCADAPFSS